MGWEWELKLGRRGEKGEWGAGVAVRGLGIARSDTITQPEPWLGIRKTEADSGSAIGLLCDLGQLTTSL